MIENFNEIKNFLTGEENETISLIKQITVIPAPSTKEFKRAEFIKNKLGKTLFEVDTKYVVPTRKLSYAIKNDVYPTFTTRKFIELLKKGDL
jgi:hypothetical protein